MTPTAEWYEADADDSDRSIAYAVTANTDETARAATETGETRATVHGDADLLRKRTAALDRVAAENERLRAEVERLRTTREECERQFQAQVEARTKAEVERDEYAVAYPIALARAEAAEAKLHDVEALHNKTHWCFDEDGQAVVYEPATEFWPCPTHAVLARSQAPQAPAIPEAVWHAWHGDAPSPCPATADDEGVRRG